MQRFDGACAKDLVQDGDFSQELACDLFEATRKLSDVSQGYLQVVAEVRILVTFQSRNNCLENERVVVRVNLVNNLVFAFKVDGGAHEDKGCIQSILVTASI